MIHNTSIANFYFIPFLRFIFIFLLLPTISFPDPVEPIIVWNSSAIGEDSIDQISFQNTFKSIGLLPAQISLLELSKTKFNSDMLLILPHASALLITGQ